MAEIKDPENTLIMETTQGTVTIELLPDLAPGPRCPHQGTGP
jgi:peptidyl-prolyl cis-trans isomerase B (cyclophilin B)